MGQFKAFLEATPSVADVKNRLVGLTDELKALTATQRNDLYDELYEGVEAGLD